MSKVRSVCSSTNLRGPPQLQETRFTPRRILRAERGGVFGIDCEVVKESNSSASKSRCYFFTSSESIYKSNIIRRLLTTQGSEKLVKTSFDTKKIFSWELTLEITSITQGETTSLNVLSPRLHLGNNAVQ